jgi:hypothetical protein
MVFLVSGVYPSLPSNKERPYKFPSIFWTLAWIGNTAFQQVYYTHLIWRIIGRSSPTHNECHMLNLKPLATTLHDSTKKWYLSKSASTNRKRRIIFFVKFASLKYSVKRRKDSSRIAFECQLKTIGEKQAIIMWSKNHQIDSLVWRESTVYIWKFGHFRNGKEIEFWLREESIATKMTGILRIDDNERESVYI